MNTCRFCKGWNNQSFLVKYGTRHYAHLACLHDRGRLVEVLSHMPTWMLMNQLPALELNRLGVLDMVRERVAAEEAVAAAVKEVAGHRCTWCKGWIRAGEGHDCAGSSEVK